MQWATYCRFHTARRIRPHSRPGRRTRSPTEDSARCRTGTLPVCTSSGSKSLRPRRLRPNSRSRRRSARTRGCTSCFYTGTGFLGIGGRLRGGGGVRERGLKPNRQAWRRPLLARYSQSQFLFVSCPTAKSCVLVGAVGAVRMAVADEAGVGAVAVATLELADGAIAGRAGLRLVRAIAAVRLAVALPPYGDAPADETRTGWLTEYRCSLLFESTFYFGLS